MATVTVTYHAPEGDDPVVKTRGVRFFDGQPVPLDEEEHAELIAKARTNRFFVVKELTVKEAIRATRPEVSDEGSSPRVVHDPDKDALTAEAESLGIDVDGRWSIATLESKISEAKIAQLGE